MTIDLRCGCCDKVFDDLREILSWPEDQSIKCSCENILTLVYSGEEGGERCQTVVTVGEMKVEMLRMLTGSHQDLRPN
jgi:hypothetical protein